MTAPNIPNPVVDSSDTPQSLGRYKDAIDILLRELILYFRSSVSGFLAWGDILFAGSKLTDIVNRKHSDLTDLDEDDHDRLKSDVRGFTVEYDTGKVSKITYLNGVVKEFTYDTGLLDTITITYPDTTVVVKTATYTGSTFTGFTIS